MIKENYYDGMITEWYDDWLKERRDDVAYYSEFFNGFSGKVLELACGTGRVLLPIAKSGIKIDGLDSSADMLKRLHAKAFEMGLKSIDTFQQSMVNFRLPKKYDAIYVASGSFQLIISDDDVMKSLQSIRNHLVDNGFFIFDIFVPWDAIRVGKMESFRVTRDNSREDGTRCLVQEKFEIDLAKQIQNSVFKYEIYSENLLTKSIIGNFDLRWYWADEMLNILRHSGFSNVEMLTDPPLYQKGKWFVFRACH